VHTNCPQLGFGYRLHSFALHATNARVIIPVCSPESRTTPQILMKMENTGQYQIFSLEYHIDLCQCNILHEVHTEFY
jgi:hypothetical protein